jgi:ubiquitin C-terminal hydrolase
MQDLSQSCCDIHITQLIFNSLHRTIKWSKMMKIIHLQIEDGVATDVDKQWLDDEILRKVENSRKSVKRYSDSKWLKRKYLVTKNAKELTQEERRYLQMFRWNIKHDRHRRTRRFAFMSGKCYNRYTGDNLTGNSTLRMLAMGHPPISFLPEWRKDKMNDWNTTHPEHMHANIDDFVAKQMPLCHIDEILPCSKLRPLYHNFEDDGPLTDEAIVARVLSELTLWSRHNFQILWAKENRRKGAKMDKELFVQISDTVKREYENSKSQSYAVVMANILSNKFVREKSGLFWGPRAIVLDDNDWIVWYESMHGVGSYAAFSQDQTDTFEAAEFATDIITVDYDSDDDSDSDEEFATDIIAVDSDSDNDSEFEESPISTGHVGLRNLGNTCYLNSSLQMLFSVTGFVTDLSATYENLKSTDTSTEGEENEIKTMPLCSALLTVASRMRLIPPQTKNNTTREGSACPSILKKEMDKLTDKFGGYEQRDAHEFLSDLIDLLHDELKAAKANHEDYSTELPTDKYFRLDVNVCFTCDSCKYSRSKEELYRHLSVDIGKNKDDEPWTVNQGLDQFFQPEQREIKCEKCEDGLSATQTITVKSRPKALLLHLKRFIVEVNDGEVSWPKSTARVKSETSISLEKFTTGEVKGGDENQEYSLKGVVRHIGKLAMSGHYTADANRNTLSEQKQQWVNFDDGISSLTSIDKIVVDESSQMNNYMMIYERE